MHTYLFDQVGVVVLTVVHIIKVDIGIIIRVAPYLVPHPYSIQAW